MNIFVNGEAQEIENDATVADMIARLELVGRRIAVEVNEDILPKSLHAQTLLHEGDRIEIVHAIGGG